MKKEQILALAEKCGIFPRLTPAGTDEVWSTKRNVESFFDAAIESYKAELLKEVGEPVGLFDVYNGDSYIQIKPEYSDETTVKLYTFDQVAAAILKATKPLEDQLAKAEQLWQIAQGRCDGLEEKLAKAEQRVAELIPGNGKELSERMKRLATNSVWRYSVDQNKPVDMSDPNIQELFAIIDHLCIGLDSPANGASS